MKANSYKKWSDGQFKAIFIGFLALSITPIVYLLYLTKPMDYLHQQLMNTKQIYILDPTGQKYLVTALQSEEKTFEIFGKMLLKKMFSFDYRGSKDNISFLKQYMSEDSFNGIIRDTSSLRAEVNETSGYYRVKITDYSLDRLGDKYRMKIFFDHQLISKAVSTNKQYMVELNLIRDSQTQDNYAGIFLDEYKVYQSDELSDERESLSKIKEKQSGN